MGGGKEGAYMAGGLRGKTSGGTPVTTGSASRYPAPSPAHSALGRGSGGGSGWVGPELLVAHPRGCLVLKGIKVREVVVVV